MSSKYTITKISSFLKNILLMYLGKLAKTLEKSKCMTNYSKWLYLMYNVVFYLSPSPILSR